MKKNYFLLTLFILINLSVIAQLQPVDPSLDPVEQLEKLRQEEPASMVVVDEDIFVLDSAINYSFYDPFNGVSSKSYYNYDEEARNTFDEYYYFDYNDLILYKGNTTDYNYLGDTTIGTFSNRSSAMEDMYLSGRYIRILNGDGIQLAYYYNLYDLDTEEWVNLNKFILLEHEEDYTLYEGSTWDDSLNMYVVNSQNENIISGDTSYNTNYIPENGDFILNRRSITITNEEETFYSFEGQNYIYGQWTTSYYYSYEVDVSTLTAISKSYVDFLTGVLTPLDSTSYIVDEELRTLESTTYGYSEADGGFTIFYNHRENIYDENALHNQTFQYNSADELTDQGDYFYSSITVTAVGEPLADDFGINLQFPNPATKNDLVQVITNGDVVGEKYLSQIYNQQGQIIAQQQVQIGDEISLINLKSNGHYYIVITDGADRHAWKIMLAN